MIVAILCGGKGTRLIERTELLPKPLVEVGDRPILWHIMKIYAHYGFKDFILCLGYKGDKIREYFGAGCSQESDSPTDRITYLDGEADSWNITFLDTGEDTNTGGRVRQLEPYVGTGPFFVTYGDGVANIDIRALLAFHRDHGRVATLTAVQPTSQFGILELDSSGCVERFAEKPRMNVWVNGGFFVFDHRIFDVLGPDDVLEREPFERLAADRQIVAYRHTAFWQCMDTFKDTLSLNTLWQTCRAEWKIWDEIAV